MSKKQKILYLATLAEWGGAQTYIFDLATSLRNKYDILVALGGKQNGELIKRLTKLNIPVYYLENLQRSVNFYRDWLAFWNIVKLLKQTKPDIVHLNSSKAGSLGALAAKCCKIKKVIYTVHGLVLNEPLTLPKKIFYWLAEWLSAKFKNNLICVSEYDKKSLLKYKISRPKKIVVIHNGLDLKNLRFYSKEDARQRLYKRLYNPNLTMEQWSNGAMIGCIANFYQTKGLIYLIEAAREIKDNNIKFIIIGDGPERRTLTELIENYKLNDSVYLLGIIDGAAQYLKAFDIFVLPSIKEGLVYTLIEARAAGRPIIATNVGGNPEIVEHNKNGLLVAAKDFNALAENIINLLQNKPLLEKFSNNNPETAKKFDFSRMVEETEKIYQ
ncbi:hypothetical protein A3B87_03085 [Candidatus Kuenenbacteria bacterium RIFCSPHIGHO2_02_FULL_39_13]|uniref:Glycosyltransferase subfamily 4-like N-terminal domain-containing protein n=1 Tax=Candidatus Kuenenbacteria bacterium RIFCSPHIGHO2_02_FULL_39_13 TaxID=1798561 RepID=A0A1F6FMT2_9BACT|nr:MAG: hypothetical protein A3B87_03085 [Candidatus Kuenenbacteria bacterium RIFCSPHIGHO2_02_FULL_39_13]